MKMKINEFVVLTIKTNVSHCPLCEKLNNKIDYFKNDNAHFVDTVLLWDDEREHLDFLENHMFHLSKYYIILWNYDDKKYEIYKK